PLLAEPSTILLNIYLAQNKLHPSVLSFSCRAMGFGRAGVVAALASSAVSLAVHNDQVGTASVATRGNETRSTQFIKATMVFGLNCGYATLAGVNFLSSGGASIDIKLANYQDDHRGSAWGACTLVGGNSNCWWEGYGSVAPVYTVHDPLTSRDARFMDCVGPEPSPMEIRTLTVQGQQHPCQCTGGYYKGYPCQASNAAGNQCHWFIFEVEGGDTVASVDVTANGCGYNSGLNYAEFTPCSSADRATCTDEVIATVTRADCSSAPAPAPVTAPAGSAGGSGGGAAAIGDPHLQNVHGERFDLMRV
ncbi:unnamed protein product, partial [Prorocentrum cordatum]